MKFRSVAAAVIVVATTAGVPRVGECRPQDPAQTPESMSLEAWSKLIFANPNDTVVWNRELNRLKELRPQIERLGNPASDVEIALTLSHHDQLLGIAFRHLKRYPEALNALASSEELLAAAWAQLGCGGQRPRALCSDITDERVMAKVFTADVNIDTGDTARADSALKDAVTASRTTKRYGDRLALAVRKLLSRDAFGSATVLLVAEMQDAIDAQRDDRLTTSARMAEKILPELFIGISWTANRTLRDGDPRDFADNRGIGLGRSAKYGMTDPLEDEATFATARYFEATMVGASQRSKTELAGLAKSHGFISIDEMLRNARLTEYVRREMADGNFEPVAKYVFVEQMSDTLYSVSGKRLICRARTPAVTFAEIRRRLREAPAGTVAATTSDILLAFDRLAKFRDAHCLVKEK